MYAYFVYLSLNLKSYKVKFFKQISGARLGSIVQSIANLGTAFVISFIYGWKLTLVIIAFLPFIMIAGALQMKLLQGVAGERT